MNEKSGSSVTFTRPAQTDWIGNKPLTLESDFILENDDHVTARAVFKRQCARRASCPRPSPWPPQLALPPTFLSPLPLPLLPLSPRL